MSIFADFIFDYETVVIKQNTAIRLQGPSADHWLGTDEFGRDILARMVHGSRVSLAVGVVAVSIALVIGGSLGATAGFYGGKVDNVIMRCMDILLAAKYYDCIRSGAEYLQPDAGYRHIFGTRLCPNRAFRGSAGSGSGVC